MPDEDREANRLTARAARYARVGANMGGVAARVAGARLLGLKGEDASNAAALAQALGGLKGPIMKVAQLLATIPDLVPPEYAAELDTAALSIAGAGAAMAGTLALGVLALDIAGARVLALSAIRWGRALPGRSDASKRAPHDSQCREEAARPMNAKPWSAARA